MISFCSSASLSVCWAFCPCCCPGSQTRCRRAPPLAEDLLEVADLGEEHISRRPSRLFVGPDVLGPEEVGDELVGESLEGFEIEQMLGFECFLSGLAWAVGGREHQLLGRSARHAVGETVANDAEIVVELGLERELLNRRDADVPRRLCHGHDRRPVAGDVDDDFGGQLVGPSVAVDELNLEPLGVGEGEAGLVTMLSPSSIRVSAIAWPCSSIRRATVTSLLRWQSRVSSVPSTAVTWRTSSTVLVSSAVYSGKTSVASVRLKFGILEDADAIGRCAPAGELDVVREVGVDRLDPRGEGGIFQAPRHASAFLGLRRLGADDQVGLGGDRLVEPGDDQERSSALELRCSLDRP